MFKISQLSCNIHVIERFCYYNWYKLSSLLIGTLNALAMVWRLVCLQHFQIYQGTVLQTITY